MVHQNFMLVPSFTIAQNVVLGGESSQGRFVDERTAVAITEKLAADYGLEVDHLRQSKRRRSGCANASG